MRLSLNEPYDKLNRIGHFLSPSSQSDRRCTNHFLVNSTDIS